MTPLQKLPKNVGDLGKQIVAKCFKKKPKVQKIAQSGHTDSELPGLPKARFKPTSPKTSEVDGGGGWQTGANIS